MIIPAFAPVLPVNTSTLPIPLLPIIQDSDGNATASGWSPIIGIVTAIIGNVLISFALNTQRYAHIRLEREQTGKDDDNESKARKASGQYGSVQNRIAEDRARKNKQSDNTEVEQEGEEDDDQDETDALIPKLQSRKNTSSSQRHEEDDDTHDQKPRKNYLRSPLWWIGISLMVTGEAGNFLAYGFAPASIVSPLGVVALISNCLIAPLFLHEKFRKRDLAGVIVAVGGAVTIVLSAQGSNPKLGPDEIFELVKRWEFLAYAGITLAAILVLMVLSNKYGDRTILIDLGLVGLFGGYTALSTKGIASLLSYRLWHTLTFPITYALVAVLAATAVLQIKYVNRALQHFDSTRVIPTQFVMFTIFVIVGSAVLYRDFESATAQQAGMFVGGCGLTFLGVWLLTSGRRDDDDDDDAEAEEGAYGLSGKPARRISLVDDETPPVTPVRQTGARSTPGTAFSTNSFVSALSQPSSSHTQLATPTRPGKTQQRASMGAVPTLDEAQSTLLQTPNQDESPGRKPGLNQRASLSSLFAPAGFSPLTTPLSSGLSVVVADQRGRLAQAGSLRGRAGGRNSVAIGQGEGSRRGSQAVDGESPTRSRGKGDQSGGGRVEAVVDERPRVGRGATVEVVRREGT